MKITKIEKESGNIFVVTKTPNFIERLFGLVERKEKYKKMNESFVHWPGVGVYVNQLGEYLSYSDVITKKLDNFQRAF